MAYQVPGFRIGFLKAAADYSTKQFLAAKAGTTASEFEIAGAGELSLGILQNTPIAGEAGSIDCDGVSKAVYGGAVTKGDELEADANGKLVTLAAGRRVAIALEDGAADEIHSVKVAIG